MTTKFDFIYPIGYTFQDEATFTMSQLIVLHDDIMSILLFILGIVFWWLIAAVYEFKINKLKLQEILQNLKEKKGLLQKRETFVFYCNTHSNNAEKNQEKKNTNCYRNRLDYYSGHNFINYGYSVHYFFISFY